jgi:phosphoribosylaminoimidazole-succinocarboxamide synthase/phosphoribosylformylglycinamidine synthase
MARVVVDVMPKPEILDPQGKAVTGALGRLGFSGIAVRQGKRFELEVDGEVTPDRLADIERAASTLLANTVIETFDVRVETDVAGTVDADAPTTLGGTDHPGHTIDHLNEETA